MPLFYGDHGPDMGCAMNAPIAEKHNIVDKGVGLKKGFGMGVFLETAALLVGLVFLVWSADWFVGGAASVARMLGVSPLVIGMVVIGFGTSAPELLVSVMAALQGNPGIALGNAYGSNISNIALILGISALVSPIVVQSKVLKKELPLLLGATVLAASQLVDGHLSRWDAIVLLGVFVGLMLWSVVGGFQAREDVLSGEVDERLSEASLSGMKAWTHLLVGLLILIVSSRVLVWGAVGIAHRIGVSDLMIGLTIVAVGTSLPELASSVVAVRKGEHDLAIGNVIGSNLFNTLAVVGLAAIVHPMDVSAEVLRRDVVVMTGLTVLLLVLGVGLRGRQGRINRFEGGMLVCSYCAYIGYLVYGTFAG